MPVQGARQALTAVVLAWSGVEAVPHRFGGTEFRLGKREIGHIHGDSLLDIPFPHKIRDELVAAGQAQPHHVLPESGWVSFHIKTGADVDRAVALLRRSYELAVSQKQARKS